MKVTGLLLEYWHVFVMLISLILVIVSVKK